MFRGSSTRPARKTPAGVDPPCAAGWLDALAAAARIGRDIDPEMLELFAAADHGNFKNELVGAVEAVHSAIERDEHGHFGRQALLVIGYLKHAALDGHRHRVPGGLASLMAGNGP